MVPEGVDGGEVSRIAEAVTTSRDLINTPTSDLGPDGIEAAARVLADKHGAAFTSIVGDDLLKRNFPMIHAVGRAASQQRAPRLQERVGLQPQHHEEAQPQQHEQQM